MYPLTADFVAEFLKEFYSYSYKYYINCMISYHPDNKGLSENWISLDDFAVVSQYDTILVNFYEEIYKHRLRGKLNRNMGAYLQGNISYKITHCTPDSIVSRLKIEGGDFKEPLNLYASISFPNGNLSFISVSQQ